MPPALDKTLELALKLHPLTERVLVVVQAQDPALETIARASLETLERRTKLDYITQRSLPGLLAASRPPGGFVDLLIQFPMRIPARSGFRRKCGKGSPGLPRAGTSAPTGYRFGGVGGMVDDTRPHHPRSRNGASGSCGDETQDIPVEERASVPAFDSRQLQRWGISESRLPAGSRIPPRAA